MRGEVVTWRYQATHRTIAIASGGTEDVFEVREVHEFDDGELSWTEDAIPAVSDTKEGLIEVLQMMLQDVQELDVLEVGA